MAQPKESGLARMIATVTPVLEPLASAGLVIVLVLFMLAKREDIRDRLLGMTWHGQLSHPTRALADAADRAARREIAG